MLYWYIWGILGVEMNKINLEKYIEEALEIDAGRVNASSSMNDIVKYYLSKYILNNDLTNNNELYLRISIPLSVLFLIWTMKALTK